MNENFIREIEERNRQNEIRRMRNDYLGLGYPMAYSNSYQDSYKYQDIQNRQIEELSRMEDRVRERVYREMTNNYSSYKTTDEILEKLDFNEIEQFIRRKKLEKLNK